jgi:hypothetical protein
VYSILKVGTSTRISNVNNYLDSLGFGNSEPNVFPVNQTQEKVLDQEQEYQRQKRRWEFHDSSWYMRGLDAKGYDDKGCNQFTGCIKECPYYPEYGRVDDEGNVIT